MEPAFAVKCWALGLTAAVLTAAASAQPAVPAPAAEQDYPLSAYQAFGSSLGQSAQLGSLGWSDAQFDAFLEGIRAAYRGHPTPMDEIASRFAAATSQRIASLGAGRQPPAAAPQPQPASDKARLERFMHRARQRFRLQISDSGLGYNLEAGGSGVRPRASDTVVFTCVVTDANDHPLPQLSAEHIHTRVDSVLPGLAEGLQLMTVGGHALFVLPPSLTFASGDWPEGVAPGTPLLYRVTLENVLPQG